MKLTTHGAAQTTTGSRHLLEVNGSKVLLDCGLAEGKREETYRRNQQFPFQPSELDAMILSHAHVDHCGNIPNLVKQGFTGNIYCTPATRDLAALMLADSAKVQIHDTAFVNRRREKESKPLFNPLYSAKDVEVAMKQFVTIDYGRRLPVATGVTLTFLDAGHMLGSAQVLLEIKGDGAPKRFLFSGDIGRGNNEILRDPEVAENIDFLLMESTYGGREHEDVKHAREEICKIINDALERKGKIIIPSFAVGRVQQVVYVLHQLLESGCFPRIPVYVDSPLSVNATEVFRLHPECFNQEVYDFLHTKRNPFGWEEITYIRETAHSKKLNELKEPAIIISSSGMCEAGRILHHLRNGVGDDRNTVLFVGYCAQHTLGAKLLAGEKQIKIFGEQFEVKAKIARVDAFSGHADRSELLNYVGRISGSKKGIALVHGELDQMESFATELRARHLGKDIYTPHLGQSIPIL
jgi:metallo-beta-lactamase family protein